MKITVEQNYILREKIFNPDYLQSLEQNILSSPYFGVSQLSESFNTTKGFSVIFTREGKEQVIQEFPFFQSYLTAALRENCNAFYLNPLILESGGDVKPHVDCSISSYVQTHVIPRFVSVLYVKVPQDIEGGEFLLQEEASKVQTIKPQTNSLLDFRGNLTHSVNQVKSSEVRVSLVCEQYVLTQRHLSKVPSFKIESRPLVSAY